MPKRWILTWLVWLGSLSLYAQGIPQPLEYTRVYDLIDELLTDGVITYQTACRPYSRQQIAKMLQYASEADSLLTHRQRQEVAFYLDVYALERDTIPTRFVQYSDSKTYNLSLANPQFSYLSKDSLCSIAIEPILGMHIFGSAKGWIFKRWWGAELRMNIAHHVSVWGSLRDISFNGDLLSRPQYLNNQQGVEYKEATYGGDFSDSKGGISIYSWWGSISFMRENIRWGEAYHSSNIFSGRNPAVPMLTAQLTPVRWFQFDFQHAWLNSNLLDTSSYYLENTTKQPMVAYRPYAKYLTSTMFTFLPIKHISASMGASLLYASDNIQLVTPRLFGSLSIRPVNHLQLYGSVFFWDKASYLAGFNWSGWPLNGLSLRGEYVRTDQVYTSTSSLHSYTSNLYAMGHYMSDNSQSIYAELSYRPIRGMRLGLSYTYDTKYVPESHFGQKEYTNHLVSIEGEYEVHPSMYVRIQLTYNDAQASSEQLLKQYCPAYWQGQNFMALCGFSFGF